MTTQEALTKYSACYTGLNPDNFMSIEDGQELVKFLRSEGFQIQGLFGEGIANFHAESNPVENMLAEGFPADKPINLSIKGKNDWHNARLTKRWVDGGLWAWGMKWLLMWRW